MIFDVDEIPEEGLQFELQEDKNHFKIDQEDTRLDDSVRVSGRLDRLEDEIYLNGNVQTVLIVLCARCLEPVRQEIKGKVSARFVPKNPTQEWEPESEIHSSEIETECYTGHHINLTQTVHDQILLEVPQICLCSEDCKGLCGQCGINLNNDSCECLLEDDIDPRLAGLKDLKERLQ